ncbi:MAG: T9SS type A sorting domain-containing protein [Bacteroidota bacterium]
MNHVYSISSLCLLFSFSIGFSQDFTEKILNREQFKSVASLTQDYDGDGDLDIIATRWEPAGIYLLENDETQQFPATPLITENLTFYIADLDMADFDNDGDMDYVICFTDVDDGELAWFQRQDDGTYLKWTIATNKDFIMADVGDFNGDGLIDIVAVGLGNSDEQCRMYLNEGNLFFEERILAEITTEAVDAADVDGDGDLDLAVAGGGLVGNDLTEDGGARLLLNDGEGNFELGAWLISWSTANAAIWEDIEIVDLNNDGVQDVLGIRSVASSNLVMFDGANDFSRVEVTPVSDIGVNGDFILFDVDNNGLLDIVIQGFTDNLFSILYQDSVMKFRQEILDRNWDNCCNPSAKMSLGDLDNDGDMDLIFPEQGNVDEDVSWYENIDGKLYKHQIHGIWHEIRMTKLFDWDQDGDLDIFATVAGGSIITREDEIILYDNLDGTNFKNWRLNDDVDYAWDLEPADIDNDGDMDLFATARDADDLLWLRNDGFQADWVTDTIFGEANQPLGIAVGDLNNDGNVDAVVCSSNDDKVLGFTNDGSGNFSPIVVDPNVDGPIEAEIADLNADGNMDIVVVCNEASRTINLYWGDGTGGFTPDTLFSGKSARDVEVGDWNQDGSLDILTSFQAQRTPDSGIVDVLLLANNGDMTFNEVVLLELRERTNGLLLRDVDEDGDLDLFFAYDRASSQQPPNVNVGINNQGIITEIKPLASEGGSEILGLQMGDLDGDGTEELVYPDFDERNLVVVDFSITTSRMEELAKLRAAIQVYPNPTQDGLTLSSETLALRQITVYNSLGQEVESMRNNSSAISLDFSEYLPGYYFLSIQTSEGSIMKKVWKK